MAKQAHVWSNFKLPEELVDDVGFPWTFSDSFLEMMESDSPSSTDVRRLLREYNDVSEDKREIMNNAVVWATGYSIPSLAARTVLREEPVERQDEEAVHDLMTEWAKKSRWKGRV